MTRLKDHESTCVILRVVVDGGSHEKEKNFNTSLVKTNTTWISKKKNLSCDKYFSFCALVYLLFPRNWSIKICDVQTFMPFTLQTLLFCDVLTKHCKRSVQYILNRHRRPQKHGYLSWETAQNPDNRYEHLRSLGSKTKSERTKCENSLE